jgi:hypothetical protein
MCDFIHLPVIARNSLLLSVIVENYMRIACLVIFEGHEVVLSKQVM